MLSAKNLTVLIACGVLAACLAKPDTTYRIETLVPGGTMHGLNGLTFGPDGYLYGGSVAAQEIYRIDVSSGMVTRVVGAPDGEADDIAFAPDGTLVWTALIEGQVRGLNQQNEVYVIEDKIPLANPVAFTQTGRMFVGQMGIDRLWEIDFSGTQPRRLVNQKTGNLNSFEIDTDDALYGPLVTKGAIARMDIDTGEVSTLAEGLGHVVALNLDSDKRIVAVDWASGNVWRINKDTGDKKIIATLTPPLDNLAIDTDDTIYVSRPAASAIERIDPIDQSVSTLVAGQMSIIGGLTIVDYQGHETLLVADAFGYRIIDVDTGTVAVTEEVDLAAFGFPAAASDVAASDEYFVFSFNGLRPRVYMVERSSGKTVQSWSKFQAPYGIILTDANAPIVADFAAGELVQLNLNDRKDRKVLATGLAGPVGLALADEESFYVTEASAGRVTRRSLANGDLLDTLAENLQQPEGITLLSNGLVAILEVGTQQLITIDPKNNKQTVAAKNLPVGYAAARSPAPVHVPSGIVEGYGGNIFITGDIDNSILKLIPE
jgi:sugar lactone lactonase YvrE